LNIPPPHSPVISETEGKLKPARFCNLHTGEILSDAPGEFFYVTAGRNKKTYACSQLIKERKCRIARIKAKPQNRTAARRFPGVKVRAELRAPDEAFAVKWSAELRDGSKPSNGLLSCATAPITSGSSWKYCPPTIRLR